MNKTILLFLSCCTLSLTLLSQNNSKLPIIIKGTILSEKNEPLPYANIHNRTRGIGSISNYEGYFEILIQSYTDTVLITYVGYQPTHIILDSNKNFYQLNLKTNVQMLNAVEIKATNNDYLYDLIIACRRNKSKKIDKSKAYYQLKSFINNNQVELVENFYNAKLNSYNLKHLDLKVGRLGLKKVNQQIFMSLESSRAINLHDLFEIKHWFPNQPLNEVKRRIKKYFYLDLIQKYLDLNGDTIIQMELTPKKDKSRLFTSNLWINKNTEQILKVEFDGKNLSKHPFIPLFKDDTLRDMDIHIVKTFKKIEDHMVLEHIDFRYQFDYLSRNNSSYRVNTEAVIQFYDFGEKFELPYFQYPLNVRLNDYRKINAFPNNSFFWENHNELVVKDRVDSNALFLSDERTYNSQHVFSKSKEDGLAIYESPYISWKGNRVIFKPYKK